MEGEKRQIRVKNHVFMQEVVRRFRQEGRKSVTFTVYGVSMHPFLGSGRDKVVLAPPAEPRVGQVVLAEVKPQRYVGEIHRGQYTDKR